MKIKLPELILLLVLIVVPGTGISAETLEDYLIIAAKNNLELKARFLEYNASLKKVDQTGVLPDPEISFGAFIMTGEPYFNDKVTEITVMQMFPWFGSLSAEKKEAGLRAKSKYEQFNEARSRLFMKVRKSWYDLYLVHRETIFYKENIAVLKTLEEITVNRFKSDPESIKSTNVNSKMVNVLRIQIELNEIKSRLLFLKDRKTTLTSEFNALLNRPFETAVPFGSDVKSAEIPSSLKNISYKIQTDNFILKRIEIEKNAALARKDTGRKKGLPMIGLSLKYSTVLSKPDMFMPMVTLSIPLWRPKYNAFVKEAQLTFESLSAKKLDVKNDLLVKAEKIKAKFDDAKRRESLYKKQVALSSQSLELLIANYSAGSGKLEEVLEMQTKLISYKLKEITAVVEGNIAAAEINQITGKKEFEAKP